jgi:hypothetical protein
MTTDGRAHAGSQPALAILRHSKGTMYQIPSLWISYYNPTPRIAIDTGICGIKVWKGRPEVSHPLRFSSLDTIPPYRRNPNVRNAAPGLFAPHSAKDPTYPI